MSRKTHVNPEKTKKKSIHVADRIILPLSNHNGQSFWYANTDKMVELIAKLHPHVGAEKHTSRDLAQEAFYSAVLDGEKDYTSTQQALSNALQTLHAPLSDTLVRALLRILLGEPPSFRSTVSDAAPSPGTIPRHLDSLLAFLADKRYGPLIQAPVAHAFILALQPFKKGNGRLARLLSMIVLESSGYNGLLSAEIARHGNEYVQALWSVFLPEKATGQTGYLSGFIEYSYEMMAAAQAALDTHSVAQPSAKAKQEGISRSISKAIDAQSNAGGFASSRIQQARQSTATTAIITPDSEFRKEEKDTPPSNSHFYECLAKMDSSSNENIRNTAMIVRSFLNDGILEFRREDWLKRNGSSVHDFGASRCSLFHRGMIVRNSDSTREVSHYTFVLDYKSVLSASDFWARIEIMRNSRSRLIQRSAEVVKSMINEGIYDFTASSWIARAGISRYEFSSVLCALREHHVIFSKAIGKSNTKCYRFSLEGLQYSGDVDLSPATISEMDADKLSSTLHFMEQSRSSMVRKAAVFTREHITAQQYQFTRKEISQNLSLTKKETDNIMTTLRARELITTVGYKTYRFCVVPGTILTSLDDIESDKTLDEYDSALQSVAAEIPIVNFPSKMMTILKKKCILFRLNDWESNSAIEDLNVLIRMKLVKYSHYTAGYSIRFKNPEEMIDLIHSALIANPLSIEERLSRLEKSESENARLALQVVRRFISEGIYEFDYDAWVKESQVSFPRFMYAIRSLMSANIVERTVRQNDSSKEQIIYRIISDHTGQNSNPDVVVSESQHGMSGNSELGFNHILQRLESPSTPRQERLYAFLKELLRKRRTTFTLKEYAHHLRSSDGALSPDLRYGINAQLLIEKRPGGARFYEIITEPVTTPCIVELSEIKKEKLSFLYHRVEQNEFISSEVLSKDIKGCLLKEFADRGFLSRKKQWKNWHYRFIVTPESHPECFASVAFPSRVD